MYQLSNDSEFAFILSEYLSLSNEGGAATGEVLRAAAAIEPGNLDSWYKEFAYLAESIRAQAEAAEKKNALVSARDAYFRSSSYYRAADFFLHGNLSDPRINTVWHNQNVTFRKAVSLLRHPAQFIELDAVNFTIPAYFYPAASDLPLQHRNAKIRVPTIIVGSGYDGSQEALYHSTCREIVARGWNCITYEGPGQPTVRRQQNLGFIPEWWEAVTPVVDYVRSRKDVDSDRVALVGLSFGGLLAPLAATREHRLAAVVALDGMLSLQQTLTGRFPAEMDQLFFSGNQTGFNGYVEEVLSVPNLPTAFRWAINQGMFAWNTTDPYSWLEDAGRFDLNASKLAEIECPIFVGSGQNDHTAGSGQPEEMARLLGNQSHYFLFKTDLGAGEHCALGAEQQVAYETLGWLDEIFRNVTDSA